MAVVEAVVVLVVDEVELVRDGLVVVVEEVLGVVVVLVSEVVAGVELVKVEEEAEVVRVVVGELDVPLSEEVDEEVAAVVGGAGTNADGVVDVDDGVVVPKPPSLELRPALWAVGEK